MTRISLTTAALLLSAVLLGSATLAAEEEASRVRILLVIHTNGEVEGKECGFAVDGQSVREVIETNLKKQRLENRYTLDVLTGDDVTAAKVLGYYRTLKTSPDEALVFFYSGHGILNSNHEHVMTMNGRSLRRTELLMSMARHDPRLMVVLSSSCANVPGEAVKNDPARASSAETSNADTSSDTSSDDATRSTAPAAVRPGDGTALRHLFFRQQGVVDINAARVAEYGWGHPELGGTFFTVALTQLLGGTVKRLDRNQDDFVEWHEFYAALRSRTAQIAGSHGNEQNTMAYTLPAPTRATTVAAK